MICRGINIWIFKDMVNYPTHSSEEECDKYTFVSLPISLTTSNCTIEKTEWILIQKPVKQNTSQIVSNITNPTRQIDSHVCAFEILNMFRLMSYTTALFRSNVRMEWVDLFLRHFMFCHKNRCKILGNKIKGNDWD